MRRRLAVTCVVAAVLAAGAVPAATARPRASAPPDAPDGAEVRTRVLVLHDSSGDHGYLGAEYSLMVRNLLGHFGAEVVQLPVGSYRSGMVASHDATFYLGSTFDERSYHPPGSQGRAAVDAFHRDAATPERTVVWMGFNLWHLAWSWDAAWGAPSFEDRFGFGFWGHVDLGFNRVTYKDTELYKGSVLHENPGAVVDGCAGEPDGVLDCDTSLGYAGIVDPAKASVYAEASSTVTGAAAPYVTRSGNLWYVGDIPLGYISEEDRYLAFADLLHDMLGIDHATERRALVRLEDIGAGTPTESLVAADEILRGLGAPYGMAVIARYKDPFKVLSGTPSRDLSRSPNASVLRGMQQRGADVVQHGTTHQFDKLLNPFNGVSGDDFEFYRVTRNEDWSLNFVGPVPGDSARWASDRVKDGRRELDRAKLTPFAFEAPHYTASATDYTAIAELYPVDWARAVYFAPGAPDGRFVGQFYPYEIQSDLYRRFVIPENLGNIEPEEWHGYMRLLPDDLIRRARKALVVRDGFASFFFHPDYDPVHLEATVRGIQELGYRFVRPCSVPGTC